MAHSENSENNQIEKIQSNTTELTIPQVGNFCNYRGKDGRFIYENGMQGILAKQMLSQLYPAPGWLRSKLTLFSIPMKDQNNDDIVKIDSGQKIIGSSGNFQTTYEAIFGSGKLTIKKSTLKNLSDSARIMVSSKVLNPALFLKIQMELYEILDPRETRTLEQILIDSEKLSEWKEEFKDFNNFEMTLKIPLMILACNICHSEEVLFFVEGFYKNNYVYNQIRTGNLDKETPCVLLSIPGINVAYSGLPLKFYKDDIQIMNISIREIIRNLWECVLESAKLHSCKIIAMPPIGLGLFAQSRGNQMARLYFQTLFQVLSVSNYCQDFDKIFFNPGIFCAEFQEDLLNYPDILGNDKIRLFDGDVKFLAIEFAKMGKKCGILNPSDSDVTWGIYDVGEYYKTAGKAAEEDFSATSTAWVGSKGISDVYTNISKIKSV